MSYKIRTIGPVEEFTTQYGPMKKYSIQFEGSEEWVKLNQKVDSPAPTVGQELDGTIEDTKYGKQFKKAQTATGGFKGGYSNDPATRVSIERQSALKASVEAVHNYATTYGDQDPLTIEQYITRIVNVTNALAKALGNESAPKPEPKAEPVQTQVAASPEPAESIDLTDIPF